MKHTNTFKKRRAEMTKEKSRKERKQERKKNRDQERQFLFKFKEAALLSPPQLTADNCRRHCGIELKAINLV